jgi:hypothetical protein
VAPKTARGEEAAAIAAAVAQFEAEVAGPPEAPGSAISLWQRAALLEGVGAKETVQISQGGSTWLS